jgi:hypothetical protein
MLPLPYELPAALALVVGGTVACFAGYRLFRIVLAIDGFIAGAWLASSTMGSSNAAGMLVAAGIGGIIGAVVLFFAYFVGIALAVRALGRSSRTWRGRRRRRRRWIRRSRSSCCLRRWARSPP